MKFCPRSNSFICGSFCARQRQLQDRHGGGVVAQHIRRRDAGRQKLEHGLRRRRHLRQRGADIDALLEEDLDDAVAVERLRFDMLDVADLGGQRALIIIDDAARHVVRQQPVIGPDDADDRNVDVGENVGRRPHRRQHAEDRNQEGEDDESVWPPQRDLNDPHVSCLPPKAPFPERESDRAPRRRRKSTRTQGSGVTALLTHPAGHTMVRQSET